MNYNTEPAAEDSPELNKPFVLTVSDETTLFGIASAVLVGMDKAVGMHASGVVPEHFRGASLLNIAVLGTLLDEGLIPAVREASPELADGIQEKLDAINNVVGAIYLRDIFGGLLSGLGDIVGDDEDTDDASDAEMIFDKPLADLTDDEVNAAIDKFLADVQGNSGNT